MLPEDGPIVASPQIRPASWAQVLRDSEALLILDPGSMQGWFAGRAVVAWEPSGVLTGLTLDGAARELDLAYHAQAPVLAAALIPYDGTATVARYDGGLVWTGEGWRVWGTLRADVVPTPDGAECVASSLPAGASLASDVKTDLGAAVFRQGVREIAEAIRAGDYYVLNLTRRLSGTPAASVADSFSALVERTGADMAALWRTPDRSLASASPERFVCVSECVAEICPIKGTRPRAQGQADKVFAAELAESEKERAEHLMIVDLERNDLGRVCRAGTVIVDPLFEVRATPYCHQMISSVRGVLNDEVTIGDVLAATFPCGSVTGAPKIAAMKAIASLEASSRASYTGVLVVAVPGELDSSVLIRTAEYDGNGVRWGTGGGITVDSDPAEEWLETMLKASPFLGDGTPRAALRETCRVSHGQVPLLARHLARLSAGGCGPSVLARVRAEIALAVSGYGSERRYGRLAVTVESDGGVTAVTTDAASTLDVPGGPIAASVVGDRPALPAGAAKPANRSAWDLAQRAALDAGGHQAVLVDRDGLIVDGATSSVWVRVGRRLLTPLSPPAVDGIARGVVFDIAERFGYQAEAVELSVGLLDEADEVFFSNALAGVVAARGRSGPAARALAGAFADIFDPKV